MSPWVGLLKKEWRISKLWIFTTVGIVIAVNIDRKVEV